MNREGAKIGRSEEGIFGGKRATWGCAGRFEVVNAGSGSEKFLGDFSSEVIGACIEVHRCVGPGLLESAYQTCLAQEFRVRGLTFEHEKDVPVHYKGVALERGYRVDFVVEGSLIVEVKAVERLLPVHEAQLLSYLRLTGISVGLLVNFHEKTLRAGLRRLVQTPNHFL